jgi:hypothetical protein
MTPFCGASVSLGGHQSHHFLCLQPTICNRAATTAFFTTAYRYDYQKVTLSCEGPCDRASIIIRRGMMMMPCGFWLQHPRGHMLRAISPPGNRHGVENAGRCSYQSCVVTSAMDDAAAEVFVIESIVTFSRTRNRFFLSWQGYPPTSNTWEPFKSFSEKETPLIFLSKLKSCGAICDNCIKIAKSSSALNPANMCECARRSPSPIVTPGRRAIDMMKKADAQNSEISIQSKRPRDDPGFGSPVSPSNSTTPASKLHTKALSSLVASRPSDATSTTSKKAASRPKSSPKIPFKEGILWSDDDEPPQVKPTSTKPKKDSPPRMPESGLRPPNCAVAELQSSAAVSPRSPLGSSPKSGIVMNTFAVFAISNPCSVATEPLHDSATSEPLPDSPSSMQRCVFHYKDFQNLSKQSLLKKLADVASPMEVTQEQKDALGRLNHTDLWNMGIWKTEDLLTIMKKLNMQVRSEEIKHFFVRIQQ